MCIYCDISTAVQTKSTRILRDNGIPTVVWMSPILPFINDTKENIEGLLKYCIRAKVKGIICFDMGLTLREGNREYFYDALDRHFPGMKARYHQKFGDAYELPSENNRELMALLRRTCREHGILCEVDECFAYLHELPERYEQMTLFYQLL